MKGLPWGLYYNKHHARHDLDPKKLEKRVSTLMADVDVTRKPGIYQKRRKTPVFRHGDIRRIAADDIR